MLSAPCACLSLLCRGGYQPPAVPIRRCVGVGRDDPARQVPPSDLVILSAAKDPSRPSFYVSSGDGSTDSSAFGLRMTGEMRGCPPRSPPQSGSAGQLPRPGGALRAGASGKPRPTLSTPRVILSAAKDPSLPSLAPSLRELSPEATEGVTAEKRNGF